MMLDHDIEYSEQVGHAGSKSHLLGLASSAQVLVKSIAEWHVFNLPIRDQRVQVSTNSMELVIDTHCYKWMTDL